MTGAVSRGDGEFLAGAELNRPGFLRGFVLPTESRRSRPSSFLKQPVLEPIRSWSNALLEQCTWSHPGATNPDPSLSRVRSPLPALAFPSAGPRVPVCWASRSRLPGLAFPSAGPLALLCSGLRPLRSASRPFRSTSRSPSRPSPAGPRALHPLDLAPFRLPSADDASPPPHPGRHVLLHRF